MNIEFFNAHDGEEFKWEYLNPSGSTHLVSIDTYDSETDCWSGFLLLRCGDANDPYLDNGVWANAMRINETLPLGVWTINFYDNGVLRLKKGGTSQQATGIRYRASPIHSWGTVLSLR